MAPAILKAIRSGSSPVDQTHMTPFHASVRQASDVAMMTTTANKQDGRPSTRIGSPVSIGGDIVFSKQQNDDANDASAAGVDSRRPHGFLHNMIFRNTSSGDDSHAQQQHSNNLLRASTPQTPAISGKLPSSTDSSDDNNIGDADEERIGGRLRKILQLGRGASRDMDPYSRAHEWPDREEGESPSLANPGLALFSINSQDAPGGDRKLRKMFSWGRQEAASNMGSCAGASHDEEENEKTPLSVQQQPTFVSPIVKLTYVRSRAEWALEMVALVNNGIRAEISDLSKMWAAMEKWPLMLTTNDMSVFFAWFGTFASIVRTLFELEERCLFAWIEGKDMMTSEERKWDATSGRIKGVLSEGRRVLRKGTIVGLLDGVEMYTAETFAGRPVAERLPQLAHLANELVESLLDYLALKEELLPEVIVSSGLKLKDRKRFERHMWSEIHKVFPPGASAASISPVHAGLILVAATRWMSGPARRRWQRKYQPGSAREYGEWSELFFTSHCVAVVELERRVAEAEEERVRQALENSNVHARAVADSTLVRGVADGNGRVVDVEEIDDSDSEDGGLGRSWKGQQPVSA
jgi:hypothetical protein